jgi:DNA-directed RNA polymerase beta subunit
VSLLHSVRRYNYPRNILDRLPAKRRQNHPSFKGYICPVESPESKLVGLTLHLTKGVRVDAWGNMVTEYENTQNPEYMLGYGASLVPFYEHNDGARSMMGAKNLKQALMIENGQKPLIKTGNEEELHKLFSRLKKFDIIDQKIYSEDESYNIGANLLVAYMPWYGFNFEDGIVAGDHLIENKTLYYEFSRTYC